MKHIPKPPNAQDAKPDCDICHGAGWFEGHDYSSYSPKLEIYPCPLCNPVAPLDRMGKIIIMVFFLGLLTLMAAAVVMP